MSCSAERCGEIFDGSKKSTNLLHMMAHIGSFLIQLGDKVEHAIVLNFIPRVAGIQLIAENKPQAVVFFHGFGCFLRNGFIYK